MGWFSRWQDERYSRLLEKARRDRSRRAAAENPPMSPELEELALELVAIGRNTDGNWRQVRTIGERLDEIGGFTLMVEVLHRAEAIALQRGSESLLRPIERAWDGIGRWQG
jgi:hypothetical protein